MLPIAELSALTIAREGGSPGGRGGTKGKVPGAPEGPGCFQDARCSFASDPEKACPERVSGTGWSLDPPS